MFRLQGLCATAAAQRSWFLKLEWRLMQNPGFNREF